MRRSSIVAGIIVLLVGLAVGYRLGRLNRTHETTPTPVPDAREPQASVPRRQPSESKPSAQIAGEQAHAAESRRDEPASSAPEEPYRQATTPAVTAPVPAAQALVEPHGSEQAARPGVSSVATSSATLRPTPTPTPSSSSSATQPPTPPVAPAKDDATDKAAAPADDPESDRLAPVLDFLRFDPPEIQDGTVALLSIGASDDLSGVASVVGQMRGPTEDAVLPFVARDPGGTGVFTASISIPKHAETGDWFVGLLQIVDKANNPFSARYARATVPPGGVLRVVSAESDSTPPTVDRVFLEKPTVGGGEKNQVVVELTDDRSGVASVYGWFQSASKAARITFNAVAKEDGSWVGDLRVPADADCGEWSLWQIRVADKAQNYAVIPGDSPQLGHVSFTVSGGGGCDADPPVLDNVFASPTTVSNASANEVTLTISAHDQGSGLSALEGRIEGPIPVGGQAPKIFFTANADPKNPDGPIIVKIAVPEHAGRGIWRVAMLILTDKASNAHTYTGFDPSLANAYFTVE